MSNRRVVLGSLAFVLATVGLNWWSAGVRDGATLTTVRLPAFGAAVLRPPVVDDLNWPWPDDFAEPGAVHPNRVWTTAQVGGWEVEFPGEPGEFTLMNPLEMVAEPATGVKSARPAEGYAVLPVPFADEPQTVEARRQFLDRDALADFAEFYKLTPLTPAAELDHRGSPALEQAFRSADGELTVRQVVGPTEMAFLVACGPDAGRFLDSLRWVDSEDDDAGD